MKIYEIQKVVYEYNDLFSVKNRDILEKVLEKNFDINVDYDNWHEFIIENWIEKLENKGFKDAKIYYSGFYSQGNGACFDCNYFDIEKLLKNDIMQKNLTEKNINLLINLYENGYFDITIEKNSYSNHYSHEKTRYIDVTSYKLDFEKHARIYNILNIFEVCLENLRYKLSCKIYSSLENEYEELQSEQSILDTLTCNNYEFNKDGTIYF